MRSERLFKKRRRRIIIRTVLTVLGLVVLIAIPTFLSRASWMNIQTISIENSNGTISPEIITHVVQEEISGYYMHLFSRSNIFLYPKKSVEKKLITHFSRLQKVSIDMNGLSTITVHVTERAPFALWCSEEEGTCYFLDEQGLVFDRATNVLDPAYLRFSGAVLGGPLGSQYLDVAEFQKVRAVIVGVKSLSLNPVSLSVLGLNEYSLGLSGGEQIFFATHDSIDHIISNLESILSDPKLSLRSEQGLSVLTLDLRFGNKVFFKRKLSESPVTE